MILHVWAVYFSSKRVSRSLTIFKKLEYNKTTVFPYHTKDAIGNLTGSFFLCIQICQILCGTFVSLLGN